MRGGPVAWAGRSFQTCDVLDGDLTPRAANKLPILQSSRRDTHGGPLNAENGGKVLLGKGYSVLLAAFTHDEKPVCQSFLKIVECLAQRCLHCEIQQCFVIPIRRGPKIPVVQLAFISDAV